MLHKNSASPEDAIERTVQRVLHKNSASPEDAVERTVSTECFTAETRFRDILFFFQFSANQADIFQKQE